jgi:hypothetical protein
MSATPYANSVRLIFKYLRVGFSHPFPEILTQPVFGRVRKGSGGRRGRTLPAGGRAQLRPANGMMLPIHGKGKGGPFFPIIRIRSHPGQNSDRILFPAARYAFCPSIRTDDLPEVPARPPNLCPGCPHRATYVAVREVFGDEAIYPTDIGCYTLGLLAAFAHGRFSDRHGRRHRHRRRFCAGHGAQGGGIYRRLHLFPQRPVPLGQCGLQQPRFHGGRAGQRHHRHDRASAPSRRGSQPHEPRNAPRCPSKPR